MRARSRRTLAVPIVGWLLGIVTALVTPTLVYERRSISNANEDADRRLYTAVQSGWVVTLAVKDDVYTLERPRIRIPSLFP